MTRRTNPPITVWTLPDCISCDLTKRAFDRRGVEYNEVPLDEEHAALFRSRGYLSAPIVDAGDDGSWYGLRPDYINSLWRTQRDRLGGTEGDNGA